MKAYTRISKRKEIKWVKGHSRKNPHNKKVDKLAKASADLPLNAPLLPAQIRRKKTSKKTEVGSVQMKGQRMVIRILGDQYYRVQKAVRYRFEVLSKTSEFFGNVDFIFASPDILVKPGHHYMVEVNNDTENPRIVVLVAEMNRVTGLPIME